MYNRDAILQLNGKAPIRSYYCQSCGCYHVTSQPKALKVLMVNSLGTQEMDYAKLRLLQRKMSRTATRINRLLNRAYKAMSMLQLNEAKVFCRKAVELYESTIGYPISDVRLQRAFCCLKECVNVIVEREKDLQRILMRVQPRPVETIHCLLNLGGE